MGREGYSTGNKKGWLLAIAAVVLVAAIGAGSYMLAKRGAGAGTTAKPQALQEVKSVKNVKSSYDVIVVGTDRKGWQPLYRRRATDNPRCLWTGMTAMYWGGL
ncbi:hypothetical protein ACHHV8_06350 [Paenibacillus sp. TAB 01]|uniref:hypothetical protein n=1 Tax=Paenibacillus sp. TAB 01 TaxID=3368988 RepID=UPI0037528D61